MLSGLEGYAYGAHGYHGLVLPESRGWFCDPSDAFSVGFPMTLDQAHVWGADFPSPGRP